MAYKITLQLVDFQWCSMFSEHILSSGTTFTEETTWNFRCALLPFPPPIGKTFSYPHPHSIIRKFSIKLWTLHIHKGQEVIRQFNHWKLQKISPNPMIIPESTPFPYLNPNVSFSITGIYLYISLLCTTSFSWTTIGRKMRNRNNSWEICNCESCNSDIVQYIDVIFHV